MESTMEFPQKTPQTKLELPYAPAIHFRVYIWRNPDTNLKEYMHSYILCSIIYNSQDLEAARVPINIQVPHFSDYKMDQTIRRTQVLEEENRKKTPCSTTTPPPLQARWTTFRV